MGTVITCVCNVQKTKKIMSECDQQKLHEAPARLPSGRAWRQTALPKMVQAGWRAIGLWLGAMPSPGRRKLCRLTNEWPIGFPNKSPSPIISFSGNGLGSAFHLIAPGILCFVKRRVRSAQQCFAGIAGSETGQTHADRHIGQAGIGEALLHRLPQPFRQQACSWRPARRQSGVWKTSGEQRWRGRVGASCASARRRSSW